MGTAFGAGSAVRVGGGGGFGVAAGSAFGSGALGTAEGAEGLGAGFGAVATFCGSAAAVFSLLVRGSASACALRAAASSAARSSFSGSIRSKTIRGGSERIISFTREGDFLRRMWATERARPSWTATRSTMALYDVTLRGVDDASNVTRISEAPSSAVWRSIR